MIRLLFLLLCLSLQVAAQQYPYSRLSSNGAARLEAQPYAPLQIGSKIGQSSVWLDGQLLYELPFYPEGPSFVSNDGDWLILLPSGKGRIELWHRDSLWNSWELPTEQQPWLYAFPFEAPHRLKDFPEIKDCPSCADCATCKALQESAFEGDPKEWKYDFTSDPFCRRACEDPKTLFYEALTAHPAFCYKNALYYFTIDHQLYYLPFGEKARPKRFKYGAEALRWLKKRRLFLEGKDFNSVYSTYPQAGSLPRLQDGRSLKEALLERFPAYRGKELHISQLAINQEGRCTALRLELPEAPEELYDFLRAQSYSTRLMPLVLSCYTFEGRIQLR